MEEKVDFTNTEIPWPQVGDKILSPKEEYDWQLNACLNFMHDHAEGYIGGFKKAGDVLVEYVAATHRDQDWLVYPVMYNYRHYVELRLKRIIAIARQYLDEGLGVAVKGHSIKALWDTARPLIERCYPNDPKDDLRNAEAVLLEYHNLDPNGEAFRYEWNNKGDARTIPATIRHINLGNVYDVINRLAGFLDAVDTGLDVMNDHRLEWMAEMQSMAN